MSYTGKRYLILDALHARYGPFLRIGTHYALPFARTPLTSSITIDRAEHAINQLSQRSADLRLRREERDVPPARPLRRIGPLLQTRQARHASRSETYLVSHVCARWVCACLVQTRCYDEELGIALHHLYLSLNGAQCSC